MSVGGDAYLVSDAVPDSPRSEQLHAAANEDESNSEKMKKQRSVAGVRPTKPKNRTTTSTKTAHACSKAITIINSSNVHVGNVNNFNLNPNNNKQNPDHDDDCNSFDNIFTNNHPVTNEHIQIVSTHLGNGWRDVAKYLSYSEGQIDQFYTDYKENGIKEVIYQMLLDWIRVNPDDSKVKDLAKALLDADQKQLLRLWIKTL